MSAGAPTKVVYISDARWAGGAEVYLERLAGALDREKFEPAAILDPSPAVDGTAARLRALGARVERVRVRGPADLPGLGNLTSVVRLLGAEIAHVNLPSTYDAACSLFVVAARAAEARVVTTEHVTAIGRSRRRRAVKAFATKQARRVITVSRANARELRHHGVPHEKIRVVPNGVPDVPPISPAERERRRASLAMESGALLLGAVGNLVAQKAHHVLLDALASLEGRVPAHLVVIGDGERRGLLESRAADLGLSRRVTFLGQRDDAREWIACLDLHVLASWVEGMPLSVLEAMAAGIPTVAFAIDGMDEVVTTGVTGALAAPGDARALAEEIARATDSARRRAWGEAARARYEEEFTLEKMARRTEAVYEEALA